MRKLALLSFLLVAISAEARMKLQGYVQPSATITVYKTGTATNATIYENATGTSETNPFTAETNGAFAFYVDNGSYDIQFSGTGFTTYTWTDIRVAEVGVSSNVMGFGAKCNGSTDDWDAIQDAINVATPNKVLLPAATCKITDTLLIASHHTTLEGTGADSSILQFEPAANNKAAIKVDLAAANPISLVRLKGFGLHTQDTTNLKIGIDIVDGRETIVEDIVIGSEDEWIGGTSVSPFTGTGSIGIRLQGRDIGTFRNIRSCGAIPLYIANNPNFASIDLDHHKFEGFLFIPNGNNPSIYVEDGAVLTNVTFEAGAWAKGGAGFYWNDTTSTTNSQNLVFRNIRAEQIVAGNGYLISITKNSALRGLRIEDLFGGYGHQGVYLRGVLQTVFDTFSYIGTLECLNNDKAFDWRNSFCQTNSTAVLTGLVEVWGESMELSQSPMPAFGRWEPAFSNHTAGLVRRYMGVYQLAKTGSLADGLTQQIPTRAGSIVLGRISIVFKGPTKAGSFTVALTAGGAFLESTSDATITGVGNLANKITVHHGGSTNVVIRNNLGETVTYSYSYFWN